MWQHLLLSHVELHDSADQQQQLSKTGLMMLTPTPAVAGILQFCQATPLMIMHVLCCLQLGRKLGRAR
jgi:hypothetical protein